MSGDAFIEITATDNCNCSCSYCFEGSHCVKPRDTALEQLMLDRVLELCRSFDSSAGQKLTVSFWGGEPFMNADYAADVIEKTSVWPFVRYHVYSNGTLTGAYRRFLASSFMPSVRDRFHVQLSYDGSPHNEQKRGYAGAAVFETARMLRDAGVKIAFKATLSFDMIHALPEIWQSYEKLSEMFADCGVRYAPTLDTSVSDARWLADWKKATVAVARLERKFILEHGYPLWSWFGRGHKSNCRLAGALHISSSGQMFVCHGAPYERCKQLRLGDIRTDSLADTLQKTHGMPQIPRRCVECGATHCAVCHVKHLPDETSSLAEAWIASRGADPVRCSYFKWFGLVSNLLRLSVMRDPIGLAICERSFEQNAFALEDMYG